MKVKSWTINHFWQCHKQRHLLAFFLKNPRNHRENCPHIWKSPHPLKKTPVLGQKESPKLSHFFCMAPSHILNVFFAKRTGSDWSTLALEGPFRIYTRAGKSDFWKSISKADAQGALNRLYPPLHIKCCFWCFKWIALALVVILRCVWPLWDFSFKSYEH